MARFLSAAWLDDLHEAARTSTALADLDLDRPLVIEQRITDETGDGHGTEPTVVYHLVVARGAASVVAGPAPEPTVTFSQTAAVARAIAAGEESAQRAFMDGRLRVGGDLQVLMEHQSVLTALGDVFAEVRGRTDLTPEPSSPHGP